ncbi:ribosome small subunit-dependent GTPase A [Pontibacillus salicampi]|uniref:Small ribosomal subunit biogenesis GTPase RsgA n=1 Tax=Pontibacillus salicampi TaxID=1449801 RepID=A0ABV6LKI6_9BACI
MTGMEFFKSQITCGERLGRITSLNHTLYTIVSESSTYKGRLSGKLYYNLHASSVLPAIGDWVVFEASNKETALIQRVLQRKTELSRKKAGTAKEEQIIAANVDVVFIVTALTNEFNSRRLERYVYQVYESGARPVIVCTKRDLCDALTDKILEASSVAPGVPVYDIDGLTGEGIELLEKELIPGETVSLIGSSGVGKSTLINQLLMEEKQVTQAVREEDDRGRHTTTHRELFSLPGGAYVIDTPGMREVQLWGDEKNVDAAFSDIGALSLACKFRDCQHNQEPGCAVKQAIQEGQLEITRLKSYKKLKRELERLDLKARHGTHKANRMLHGPKANR